MGRSARCHSLLVWLGVSSRPRSDRTTAGRRLLLAGVLWLHSGCLALVSPEDRGPEAGSGGQAGTVGTPPSQGGTAGNAMPLGLAGHGKFRPN